MASKRSPIVTSVNSNKRNHFLEFVLKLYNKQQTGKIVFASFIQNVKLYNHVTVLFSVTANFAIKM